MPALAVGIARLRTPTVCLFRGASGAALKSPGGFAEQTAGKKRMAKGVVSERRKAQARKHAARRWTCYCGKVCRGNGGKSSHKAHCQIYAHYRNGLDTSSPYDLGAIDSGKASP